MRLHIVVTCAALLVFAWLTTRHVGEATFLEDQVDTTAEFRIAAAPAPRRPLGAVMSGTARTLGPLGAIVFGVPVALGFGIDSIHVTTSLLIAIATAICFVGLARIDVAFAWRCRRSRCGSADSRDIFRADRSESVLFWLTVCGVAFIAGQALFLWWMARPFEGDHHLTLLTPFYAVVPAALLRRAVRRQPRSAPSPLLLGCIVLAVLVLAGPSLADRTVPVSARTGTAAGGRAL